jgi:hypothetical protein
MGEVIRLPKNRIYSHAIDILKETDRNKEIKEINQKVIHLSTVSHRNRKTTTIISPIINNIAKTENNTLNK